MSLQQRYKKNINFVFIRVVMKTQYTKLLYMTAQQLATTISNQNLTQKIVSVVVTRAKVTPPWVQILLNQIRSCSQMQVTSLCRNIQNTKHLPSLQLALVRLQLMRALKMNHLLVFLVFLWSLIKILIFIGIVYLGKWLFKF